MLIEVYGNENVEEIDFDLDNLNFVKLNKVNNQFFISISKYKGDEYILALDKKDKISVEKKYNVILDRINLITSDFLFIDKNLSVNMHNIVDLELEKNNKLLKDYSLKIYFYDGKIIESTKSKFSFKFNNKIFDFKARQRLLDGNFIF